MSRPKSKFVTVSVVGALVPYVQQFRSLLAERGYTPLSRVNRLQVMVHLSKRMNASEVGLGNLTFERVDEYLARRRSDG